MKLLGTSARQGYRQARRLLALFRQQRPNELPLLGLDNTQDRLLAHAEADSSTTGNSSSATRAVVASGPTNLAARKTRLSTELHPDAFIMNMLLGSDDEYFSKSTLTSHFETN